MIIDETKWQIENSIKINGVEIWNKNQLLMNKILVSLSNMPYYPNSKKEHEKAVKELLLSHGMVEKFEGKYGKGRSDLTSPFLEKEEYPKGQYFIWQPHGSQKYPDFYLFFDGVKIPLECKTAKSAGKITWNSGYPKKGGIYVFADGRKDQNKNYLFMGEDHWDSAQVEDWFADMRKLKSVVADLCVEYDKKYNKSDFYLYFREMWTDRILISETDTEQKLKNVYAYCYKELI